MPRGWFHLPQDGHASSPLDKCSGPCRFLCLLRHGRVGWGDGGVSEGGAFIMLASDDSVRSTATEGVGCITQATSARAFHWTLAAANRHVWVLERC